VKFSTSFVTADGQWQYSDTTVVASRGKKRWNDLHKGYTTSATKAASIDRDNMIS